MKSKEKGLQKLTDSKSETGISLSKVEAVLSLEKINMSDLKGLSDFELDQILIDVGEKVNTLKGVENDKYWEKIDAFIGESFKNQRWEKNHADITAAISNLMQNVNRMPSMRDIADETGLSRQTIYKHIGEYSTNKMYLEQMEQFSFLGAKVLSKVFIYAIQGDLKACKLYLDTVGVTGIKNTNNTLVQTQNNYIQINGITLSQDQVKNLNPEQLRAIETILKTALPE